MGEQGDHRHHRHQEQIGSWCAGRQELKGMANQPICGTTGDQRLADLEGRGHEEQQVPLDVLKGIFEGD